MAECHILLWTTETSTSDLLVELSCSEHVSYIILGGKPEFGVWLHLGMTECRVSV